METEKKLEFLRSEYESLRQRVSRLESKISELHEIEIKFFERFNKILENESK